MGDDKSRDKNPCVHRGVDNLIPSESLHPGRGWGAWCLEERQSSGGVGGKVKGKVGLERTRVVFK